MRANSVGDVNGMAACAEATETPVLSAPQNLPRLGEDLLVALDIDGTLVDFDEQVDPTVVQSIDKARSAGAEVVIATGRPIPWVMSLLPVLGMESCWAVCSNGAVTMRVDRGSVNNYEIFRARSFDTTGLINNIFSLSADPQVVVESNGRDYWSNRVVSQEQLAAPHDIVSVEELCATPATRLLTWIPDLDDNFGVLTQSIQQLDMQIDGFCVGWSSWLDVAPPGVSKATGLEELRLKLGISPDATVAVGDGSNDEQMLKWASWGVAMGNSSPRVQACADAVCPSVKQKGVVSVLEALS